MNWEPGPPTWQRKTKSLTGRGEITRGAAHARAVVLLVLLVAFLPARLYGQEDVVFFRDGTSRRGSVLQETAAGYTFSSMGRSEHLPLTQVRFVLYGTEERTAERLGLHGIRERHVPNPEPAVVDVLPAPEFAAAVQAAIADARRSVYLTTYVLSTGDSGGARELFDLLLQKGREKKTVVILAPVGPRTQAAVRTRSINLGKELEEQGLSVRFLETTKLQHKKLIIVDNQVVFIGSSNLTGAGLSSNQEINLRITDPTFVAAARRDFDRLRRRSKRWLDLQR